MFPFEFVQRSEQARAALSSSTVRVWDIDAWAFWSFNGAFTTNENQAKIFEFPVAWELALKHRDSVGLLFDPVNGSAEAEGIFQAMVARTSRPARDAQFLSLVVCLLQVGFLEAA
jgi:hypothetical protein